MCERRRGGRPLPFRRSRAGRRRSTSGRVGPRITRAAARLTTTVSGLPLERDPLSGCRVALHRRPLTATIRSPARRPWPPPASSARPGRRRVSPCRPPSRRGWRRGRRRRAGSSAGPAKMTGSASRSLPPVRIVAEPVARAPSAALGRLRRRCRSPLELRRARRVRLVESLRRAARLRCSIGRSSGRCVSPA